MNINQRIKNMVRENNHVHFQFYRNGELWYEVYEPDIEDSDSLDGSWFQFPVPIKDTGDAVFKDKDKALLFMRYIRKHIENIEAGKTEQGV